MEARGKLAIILAPDNKGLTEVFKLQAARRLVLLSRQSGFKNIHVIGIVRDLRPVLSDLIPPIRFHPVDHPALLADEVEKLNLAGGDHVLVMKANHVADRKSLRRLTDAAESPGIYYMEATQNPRESLFMTTPEYLASILRSLWLSLPLIPLTADFYRVEGSAGIPCLVNERRGGAKAAEHNLMRAQAAMTEETDGFLARHINRRISRVITAKLVHTSITPNEISLIGTIVGLAGAAFFAMPGYWHHLIGALIFLLCNIFKGVDGEIARLKLQESKFGERLDIVMDNIVNVAIFSALAVGLYRDSGNAAYFTALGFLLGGFALCGLAAYQCLAKRSPEERRRAGPAVRMIDMLDNRDFAYLLVVLALVERLEWFLIGAAVGTYFFAAILWIASDFEQKAVADRAVR